MIPTTKHPQDCAGRPSAGGLVEWAITARCDLRCRHCYSAKPRGRELSTRRALSLADELVAGGVQAVALSGGEPTLRRDWPLVTERLARGGVATRMISNGQSLDRDGVRRARDAGLDFIWFSLDGLEATHDRIRRARGAFSRVMDAAARALAEGLPFGFMTTVLRSNRHQLRPLSRLAQQHGASRWQVWLGVPQDASRLWLPPAEHPVVAAELQCMERVDPRLSLGDNITANLQCARCEAGNKVLALLGDGSVKGCLALPGPASRVTIRDASLADLWMLAQSEARRRGDTTGASGCHAMALALAAHVASLQWDGTGRASTLGQAAAWTSTLLLASTLSLGCPQKDQQPAPTGPPATGEVQQSPVKPASRTPDSAVSLPPDAGIQKASTKKAAGRNKRPRANKQPGNRVHKLNIPAFRPCMTSHVGCMDGPIKGGVAPGTGKKKP